MKTSTTTDLFLSAQQLSKRWKNKPTVRTLANWRYLGKGPKVTKIGGTPMYKLAHVETYETKQARKQ